MPIARVFTAAQDDTIREMLAAGKGAHLIGLVLGISKSTITDHANKACLRPLVDPEKAAPAPPAAPQSREPLPAGHPVTWGLLTAGGLLEGVRYPHPVRTDLHPSRIGTNSQAGMALRGVG
jgi:hypothetical protein